jgi:hypothetical protein
LLENGVSQVQWFSLYTGLNDAHAAADIGLLSTGNCKGKVREQPAGTPFPDYYAMQRSTWQPDLAGGLLPPPRPGPLPVTPCAGQMAASPFCWSTAAPATQPCGSAPPDTGRVVEPSSCGPVPPALRARSETPALR